MERAMAIRRTGWAIWCWRTGQLLLALGLSACVASSGPAPGIPLRIVDAAVVASPARYSQSCGAKQTFRYTATLTANDRNTGGTAHYRLRIGFSIVEGDVTFAAGETTREITQTVTTDVQPDAEPLLVATMQTTAPNAVSSPQVEVRLSCSAPFQVLSADAMVSPSSVGCGSQIVGFSAILAATEGNPGGDVRYTWHFLDGSNRAGQVTFAPRQINATVAIAPTYFVSSGLPPRALPARAAAPAPGFPTLPPFPTPRPTRTPRPTPTPKPTPSPTPGPRGTPAGGGQIGAWLTVDSPNSLQSDTVAATVVC
jgi:hypothetical protein